MKSVDRSTPDNMLPALSDRMSIPLFFFGVPSKRHRPAVDAGQPRLSRVFFMGKTGAIVDALWENLENGGQVVAYQYETGYSRIALSLRQVAIEGPDLSPRAYEAPLQIPNPRWIRRDEDSLVHGET